MINNILASNELTQSKSSQVGLVPMKQKDILALKAPFAKIVIAPTREKIIGIP